LLEEYRVEAGARVGQIQIQTPSFLMAEKSKSSVTNGGA
jgi:hypothetical protein